jgi:hypothetical protein
MPFRPRPQGRVAAITFFREVVMRKLMLALVAGCMSAAAAGAYAAAGSPADSDKAGRMPPGTSAGQMGATDPTPGKAGASKGGAMSKGEASPAGSSAAAGGASATTSGSGSSATAGTGDDTGKAKRSRRAARASKG